MIQPFEMSSANRGVEAVTRTALALAAVTLAASALAAPEASAANLHEQDSRHCVSEHEFNNVFNMPNAKTYAMTRSELERRWDVAREGSQHLHYRDNRHGYAMRYRACGFALYGENAGFVLAWYNRDTDRLDGIYKETVGYPSTTPRYLADH